ncbi:hypothetical protein B0O99DRAFT_614359 [Bisporella sp. PMI_857]|nr:hypothetical protein B0O99DRAFT_614359 [Bisporella sp. PMI_857]
MLSGSTRWRIDSSMLGRRHLSDNDGRMWNRRERFVNHTIQYLHDILESYFQVAWEYTMDVICIQTAEQSPILCHQHH